MILTLALLASAQAATQPSGTRSCSPATYKALTAPRIARDKPFSLNCSVTLRKGDSIPRRLSLQGPRASGVTIDCNGGAIGYAGILTPLPARAVRKPFLPTVSIQSAIPAKGNSAWQAPSNITIQRCHIFGTVRTLGMGSETGKSILRSMSHRRDFTSLVQQAAPTRITIRDTLFTAYRHVALYVGAGTRALTVTGSRFAGQGEAAIYLDMESRDNQIRDNVFAMKHSREVIAIDGSARNVITGNRFILSPGKEGINLYRNCGESAIVRHQTPSDNRIAGNQFITSDGNRAIIENARSSRRTKRGYCAMDDGYPFGSGADDNDNATGNRITDNRITRR